MPWFHLRLNPVSNNGKRRYICSVFSHWPRHSPATGETNGLWWDRNDFWFNRRFNSQHSDSDMKRMYVLYPINTIFFMRIFRYMHDLTVWYIYIYICLIRKHSLFIYIVIAFLFCIYIWYLYDSIAHMALFGVGTVDVSWGGNHRHREKTTMERALDGGVCDITQILAYPVQNMSRSQLCLGFYHFGSLFWPIGMWWFFVAG